jgi:deoxyadenosine/deoxycytidine kinase
MSCSSPMVISIEGNIGSGKSTMLAELQKRFTKNKNIAFVFEPVDVWREIKDSDGVDLLTKFYEDQEKFSFHFQMAAYISRISTILRSAKDPDVTLIIVERSIWSDKNVFAKMLYDDKKITELEYNIYLKWFDEFSKLINHVQNIYIETTPIVAWNRINERNRSGETIPMDYLVRCHTYHNEWLESNSMKIDGNIELPDETNINTVESIINTYIL